MLSATRNCPKAHHLLTQPTENRELGEPASSKEEQAAALTLLPTPLKVRISLNPPFAQRIAPTQAADAPTTPQALSLLEHGRFVESIDMCNRVLSEAPCDFIVLTIKAIALGCLRDWQDSLNATEEALEIYPDNFLAWTTQSNALRMLDRLGPALEAANTALSLSPKDANAYQARALTLQCLGRRQEALEDVNRAMAILAPRNGLLDANYQD